MSINFSATPYESMIDNFQKTISRTPVTKTTSNFSDDETLTDGTPANITGAFYRQEDDWVQDKEALLQGADAVLKVKSSVTVNKDDKLTYDGETYRVDKVVTRRLNNTSFYKLARCFLIQ